MNASTMITDAVPVANSDMPRSTQKSACIAIVWVRGALPDQPQGQALIERIESQDGVTSARFSTGEPLLITVDYVPGQISTSSIVRCINGQGIRGRLVGC